MLANYIAAAAALVAAGVSYINHRRIREVHILVNNQLDEVMLKLEARTEERDRLQKEKNESDQPSK